MKYYRFFDLPQPEKSLLFSIAKKINYLVEHEDEVASMSDHWSLCDFVEGEMITYIDYVSFAKDINLPMKVTIDSVYKNYPVFKEILTKYDLYPYIGKVKKGNWGIHRHTFCPDTHWNMCLIDNVPAGTSIEFHEKIDSEDEKKLSDDYKYDHMGVKSKNKIVDRVEVKPGDILTLNVWQWHSFNVPDSALTDVYFFYIKNITTDLEMSNYIKNKT